MKKTLIFVGGAMVGYFLNTTTGKNLRNWAYSQAQNVTNNLIGKINKVTIPDSDPNSIEKEG